MDRRALETLCDKFLAAWTEQDVEKVVATYTEDLIYRDPNTRGEIRGADAMRRYLKKLFEGWEMTWKRRELHPLAESDGIALLWHATFKKPGDRKIVEADGMDIVELRGNLVARNEVHFDRTPLMALAAAEPKSTSPKTADGISVDEMRELLNKNWMTHDAMWFMHCTNAFGIEKTNPINRAAVRSMSQIEVKRVAKILGAGKIETFDELYDLMQKSIALVLPEFMRFTYSAPEKNVFRAEWPDGKCFAYQGVKRLGQLDSYECGIFDRIDSWFDSLGIEYEATPKMGICLMHTEGKCVREYRFKLK